MQKTIKKMMMTLMILAVFSMGYVFAASGMEGHDMGKSDKIGDLIHESTVNGYMLSYYFMDLRDQKDNKQNMDTMDKPHHLMIYIMDKNHKPVLKGKVGFIIKDAGGHTQKAMGMFMSKGFGTTADMKKKGVYTITTKAILGDKKLMDKFNYEIKEKKMIKSHWTAPVEEGYRKNPVADTSESILRGQNLYIANCAGCHGSDAEGDGPDAEFLDAKPANLRAMAGHHPDGDMAWKIKHGKGDMPAWSEIFTGNQTWDIVNFLQNMKKKN